MKANHIQTGETSQSGAGYVAAKLGSGLGFSMKYVIPFAAGFYVGMMDGNNIEMESTTKYALLTAPTAAGVGLVASISGFTKFMGKVCTDPRFRYEATQEAIRQSGVSREKAAEALSKLEDLANTSVIKKAAKAAVKPGIMTTIGYVLGYGCAKLSL